MDPRTLAKWLAEQNGTAGIVFGNERTGLDETELNLCNIASHIPVSGKQPSVNLSHAVLIYAYEFFLELEKPDAVKGEWQAMDQEGITQLTESITNILADVGFYKITDRQMQSRFLRDVISRAGLTESEGGYFRDIIAKAVRLGAGRPES
jgi:tRNA C32,U32 (ribose-2'-O)-methylase TrmJ